MQREADSARCAVHLQGVSERETSGPLVAAEEPADQGTHVVYHALARIRKPRAHQVDGMRAATWLVGTDSVRESPPDYRRGLAGKERKESAAAFSAPSASPSGRYEVCDFSSFMRYRLCCRPRSVPICRDCNLSVHHTGPPLRSKIYFLSGIAARPDATDGAACRLGRYAKGHCGIGHRRT